MRGGSNWLEMNHQTISCLPAAGGGVVTENDGGSSTTNGLAPPPTSTHSSPAHLGGGWQHHLLPQVKQEVIERDDRIGNDSGISSAYTPGSDDFQSSSPGGSSHSDQNSRDSTEPLPANLAPYASPSMGGLNFYNNPNLLLNSTYPGNGLYQPYNYGTPDVTNNNNNLSLDSDKLKTLHENKIGVTSPDRHSECSEDGKDSLQRLQIAIEQNSLLPPGSQSPHGSEHNSISDKSEEYNYEEYETSLRTPRVNSHGKVKTHKCKQCEFVAVTKLEFWEHSRVHIKSEKLLTCPKCPFVTEYKHHLEYHLRNHFGSKPFKCSHCKYVCVNKSMLNSHLKSHSNIYQYRCSDCQYVTKYCHSLKLHLRKYKHSPAMVLNPDGSPNPLPIIDVYGTRRGPKQRTSRRESKNVPPPTTPPTSTAITYKPDTTNPPVPTPPQQIFPPHFMLPTPPPNPIPFPFNQFMIPNQFIFSGNNNNIEREEKKLEEIPAVRPKTPEHGVLDLSSTHEKTTPTTPTHKNRRKGRAFKLGHVALQMQHNGDDSDPDEGAPDGKDKIQKMEEPSKETAVDNVEELSRNITHSPAPEAVVTPTKTYNCQYCDIIFKDVVMYTMHMGYHGYNDPFKCNMCGEETSGKVSFFLHIARSSHS